MLNFVENLLENERGPMNDQDLTKTDYDPDRSLVLIEGLSHFLTNFLQNLASCQTSLKHVIITKKKKKKRTPIEPIYSKFIYQYYGKWCNRVTSVQTNLWSSRFSLFFPNVNRRFS
jgi:hypothetical protein